MNINTRSRNTKRNIAIGIINQVIMLSLSFISKTIFIKLLGAEYLGVNGLYSNILTLLSLAELGIGNVMIYSLYRPVAENDKNEIYSLLEFYKKIYNAIAISIFVIGILLIPFLHIIIKSDISIDKLIIYYLIFLLNSVLSYFSIYKSALINATQQIYIINTVNTVCTFLQHLTQILILLLTKNYILYLSVQVIFTLVNNVVISNKANKMYPFIKDKSYKKNCIDTQNIKENIKSVFLHRIGNVIMNNTDNILISSILGTVYVGYYSNYNLLIGAVANFINIIIQSMMSSLGNLNASDDMEKSYSIFNILLLLFHWLSAICSISLILVINDFVTIWLGKEFILNSEIVLCIIFNFYIKNAINPVWMYRETMGLFNNIKYTMLFAALINMILSVILGLKFGLAGIIISTALARIFTTVWYEPKSLFKLKFKKPVKEYWKNQIRYLIGTIITLLISNYLLRGLDISLFNIFIKLVTNFIILTIIFIITNLNNSSLKLLSNKIKDNINIKIA